MLSGVAVELLYGMEPWDRALFARIIGFFVLFGLELGDVDFAVGVFRGAIALLGGAITLLGGAITLLGGAVILLGRAVCLLGRAVCLLGGAIGALCVAGVGVDDY